MYIYLEEAPFLTGIGDQSQSLGPFLSIEFWEINHRDCHLLKYMKF